MYVTTIKASLVLRDVNFIDLCCELSKCTISALGTQLQRWEENYEEILQELHSGALLAP